VRSPLRCVSQVESKRSVVAEGTLTVDPVADIDFEIEPKRVRRRWSSRHVIQLENRGNTTAVLRPVIVDPQHELSLSVSPSQLQIPASNRDFVLVKARARRPKLLSKPSNRCFCVSFAPAARIAQKGSQGEGDGRDIEFEQVPVLPRTLTSLVILIAVVATVVGAALLMFGGPINRWF
jgi:hypothetical protein